MCNIEFGEVGLLVRNLTTAARPSRPSPAPPPHIIEIQKTESRVTMIPCQLVTHHKNKKLISGP